MPEPIISKRCSKCKEIKPLSEFHKNQTRPDGYQATCKSCKAEYQRKYRKADAGKVVQNRYQQTEKFEVCQLRYRRSEKGKITRKLYRQSERGRAVQKHADIKYYKTEKGKKNRIARIEKFITAHPEIYKARMVVKYAVETGRLPQLDTLQCHYCPKQAKQYHHHKGYAKEHRLDVIPICIKCHNKISNPHKALPIA